MIDLTHWPIIIVTVTGPLAIFLGLYQAILLAVVVGCVLRVNRHMATPAQRAHGGRL